MTIDWRAISEDPNDKTAHIAWLKKYNSDVVKVFSCPKNGRDEIILSLIDEHANKNVLDIGFVEHTLEYIHRPDWFHRKLRKPHSPIMPVFEESLLSNKDAADIYLWLQAQNYKR